MKSSTLESFLCGVTLGIGLTLVALYAHKPGRLAASLEAIAEKGRARKVREIERSLRRERLREIGFSDEEIEEIL